jgi:site-specific recombinase XerD
MLVLYRRHVEKCQHQTRTYRKCDCPIWFDWKIQNKRIQKPVGTKDWQVAQMRARQLEAEGITSDITPQTIEQASKKFLEDCKARGLRESSLRKYKQVLNQLERFCQEHGLAFLSQLTVDELRNFRASWTNRNLSAQKKLENLRAFFRFCHDSDWVKKNPAKLIKTPKIAAVQVLPFSDAEMEKILAACDSHAKKDRAVELRTLILLLRHSGLRISDAATLARDRIKDGMLELHTSKTGTKVRMPLNPVVLKALELLPAKGTYYFWNGESKRETAVKVWERTFQQMFKRAEIDGGHGHQLRHTFAVNLLQKGVPIESVGRLLGHTSVRITERYYSAWVKARQDRLEADVRATW